MSEKQYTTDNLVFAIENNIYGIGSKLIKISLDEHKAKAIIARLKAGEKLWELVKINALNLSEDGYDNIVEAIQDYGEAK
jgi:hypothetical protein